MSTSDVSATDSGDTMDTAEDESLDMGDEALDMGDVNGNSTKGRPILSLFWFALARAFCLGKLLVCFCLFLCVCLVWVKLPVFFSCRFYRMLFIEAYQCVSCLK